MTSTDRITGTVRSVTPPTGDNAIGRWNVVIDVDDPDEFLKTPLARFSTVKLVAGDRVETFEQDPACYIIGVGTPATETVRDGNPFESFIAQAARDCVEGHAAPAVVAQRYEANSADPRPPDGRTLMMTALRSATSESEMEAALEPLVSDAMDAAVLHIQEALGVDDGGFAGQYFDEMTAQSLSEILMGYAVAQWCDSAPSTPSPVMARIRALVERFDIQPGDDRAVIQEFAFVHEASRTSITDPTHSPDGFAEVDPYLRYGRENVDKWLIAGEAVLIREIASLEAELVRMRGGK